MKRVLARHGGKRHPRSSHLDGGTNGNGGRRALKSDDGHAASSTASDAAAAASSACVYRVGGMCLWMVS